MNQAKPRHNAVTRTRAGAIAITTLLTACAAWPCGGVGPARQPVVFGDQTNIIIWDEEHHLEHFIRNASFRSEANDFGFIAPTPGKPELHEASNQAFYTLANLAPTRGFGAGGGLGGGLGGVSRSADVKVIQEADVAGYHATTLQSASARAIKDWMSEHGYVSTPEFEKWAERYTKRRWYLTAFKVIDRNKFIASTGTIRMTFETGKAFNPFYVPATNIQRDRKGTLRVYFVSVGDYNATIGGKGAWQTPEWTATIPASSKDQLAKQIQLPTDAIPDKAQVETFVDNDFPRPAADDIYFTKKNLVPPEEPIAPPARTIPPLELPLLLTGVGLLAVVGRRFLG